MSSVGGAGSGNPRKVDASTQTEELRKGKKAEHAKQAAEPELFKRDEGSGAAAAEGATQDDGASPTRRRIIAADSHPQVEDRAAPAAREAGDDARAAATTAAAAAVEDAAPEPPEEVAAEVPARVPLPPGGMQAYNPPPGFPRDLPVMKLPKPIILGEDKLIGKGLSTVSSRSVPDWARGGVPAGVANTFTDISRADFFFHGTLIPDAILKMACYLHPASAGHDHTKHQIARDPNLDALIPEYRQWADTHQALAEALELTVPYLHQALFSLNPTGHKSHDAEATKLAHAIIGLGMRAMQEFGWNGKTSAQILPRYEISTAGDGHRHPHIRVLAKYGGVVPLYDDKGVFTERFGVLLVYALGRPASSENTFVFDSRSVELLSFASEREAEAYFQGKGQNMLRQPF